MATPFRSEPGQIEIESVLRCMYALAGFLIGSELGNTAKNLIRFYFTEESNDPDISHRARRAVERYTQVDIPSLSGICSRRGTLGQLDRLVLAMEYEAQGRPGSTRRSVRGPGRNESL